MSTNRDIPMPGWKWCPTCGSGIPDEDPLRPDPRIAKVEAVLDHTENLVNLSDPVWISEHDQIFAILRGDD